MVNKKILGMPLAMLVIGLLMVGVASAALLTYYVNIVGTADIDQSVVWWDGTTASTDTKVYAFAASAVAGNSYTESFMIKNQGTGLASVELETLCAATLTNCIGINAVYTYFEPLAVLNDDVASFGAPATQSGSTPVPSGTTLNDIFAGDGFSYTYDVVNQGSDNGANAMVVVFELVGGEHVVLFPGYGARPLGEYSLTFSDTVAVSTNGGGNAVVDFALYGSTFVGIATGAPYVAWDGIKADFAKYGLVGTEEVVRIFFMHQGANTGQIDNLMSYTLQGAEVDNEIVISGPIDLEGGEVFGFDATFAFDAALMSDTFNIETRVVPAE